MKNNRILLLFICIFIFTYNLSGQCSCTDCPIMTVSNSTVTSTINISGATNTTLGVNNQSLIEVCFNYDTDAIDEVDITLASPSGDVIFLVQTTGISVNSGLEFDFCFITCTCPAMPDPGFSEQFDSEENWIAGTPYVGTYYPADGNCFQSYTGSVNGDWVLTIEDHIGWDDGVVHDWSLGFADNSGLECITQDPCIVVDCAAYGGEIAQSWSEYCEGDPALDLNIPISYLNNPQPDQSTHSYTFVISDTDTGVIIAYEDGPNLTEFPPGLYSICGMSYLQQDFSSIPQPNGVYSTTDLQNDISDEDFCADIALDCWDIEIHGEVTPIVTGPLHVCDGETVQYLIENHDPTITYLFYTVPINSYVLNLPYVDVTWTNGPGELCIESTNECGSNEVCLEVVIADPNTEIDISGETVLCPQEIVTYNLSPALLNNQSWQFSVVNGFIVGETSNSVTIAWEGLTDASGSFCVDIVGFGCDIEPTCAFIEFTNFEPSISLNSLPSLCLGDNGESFITPSSDYLNYNWILTNLIEVGGNGTPSIQYTTDQVGPASVCLEIATICGIQEQICEIIDVEPTPTANLEVVQNICEGDVSLFATIDPGSAIIWSQISGPSQAIILFPTSIGTNVIISAAGEYIFNAQITNNGCTNNVQINVSYYDQLVAGVESQECVDNQSYQATISISGGNSPYYVDGFIISESTYISDDITSGDTYTLIISDSNGCTTTVSGTYSCDCDTQAGEMSGELLEACAQMGSTVESLYLGGEILDANDNGIYILHTNNGTTLGDIYDMNTTGVFQYINLYEIGVTYYISYVAGDQLDGFVDLNDPCLSISVGQPIIFYGIPASDIPEDQVSCSLTSTYIFSNVSNTFALEWNVISGDGDATITVQGLETLFEFDTMGDYIFEYQLVNEICQFSGQFTISVSETPTIESIQTTCSDDLMTFDTELTLSGGNMPYLVNNMNELDPSTFSATNLPVEDIHNFTFQDALGCEGQFTVGPINCSCSQELGTISLDTILLCQEELLNPNFISNQDFILVEGQDTFAYLFYESEGDPIDAPIYVNYGELVDPTGILNIGQVYYIRFAVGPKVGSGSDIDLASTCFLNSALIPIMWNPTYDFIFDIHPTVCSLTPTYEFDPDFPGPFPYTVMFSSDTDFEVELLVTDENTIVTLPIFPMTTAWTITDISTDCGFNFSGNLTLTVIEPFDYDIIPVDTICNNTLFGSTINLPLLIDGESIDGVWSLDGEPVSSDIIDFDGYPEGNYSISFSTAGFEGPCPGSSSSFNIFVKECSCPIVTSSEDIELCSSGDPIDLENLWMSNLEGTWQISNSNGLDHPPIIDGNLVLIENASSGNYQIIFSLNDPFPSECQIDFPIELVIEEQLVAGEQINYPIICEDDLFDIDLPSMLDLLDMGGTWTSNGIPSEAIVEASELIIGPNTFIYEIPATNLCTTTSAQVVLEKIPNPVVELITSDVMCFGDENGEIELILTDNGFLPYSWAIDDVPTPDETLINLAPGNYSIEVSNISGCSIILDDVIIGEPDIVSVNLGDDKTATLNETITIEALVNLITSDIGTINWSDLTGEIDEDDLILIKNTVSNNTISIVITDTNGCIAYDEINIRLNLSEIKLSNIFAPNSTNPVNTSFGVPAIAQIKTVDEFRVYDRWGNLMHNAQNFSPGDPDSFWNGSAKGQQVVAGVYGYYVKYTDIFDTEKIIVGDVTVVK